jgi:hypothetical protein
VTVEPRRTLARPRDDDRPRNDPHLTKAMMLALRLPARDAGSARDLRGSRQSGRRDDGG